VNTADTEFFGAVMAAGAIITGFCGSFLAFRLQREAVYFRNPAQGYVGQQYFSPSLLLLLLASLAASVAGLVFPLLGLRGVQARFVTPNAVVAGLLSALFLLTAYFFNEIIHYRIAFEGWRRELEGWDRERPIVVVALLGCLAVLLVSLWLLP